MLPEHSQNNPRSFRELVGFSELIVENFFETGMAGKPIGLLGWVLVLNTLSWLSSLLLLLLLLLPTSSCLLASSLPYYTLVASESILLLPFPTLPGQVAMLCPKKLRLGV